MPTDSAFASTVDIISRYFPSKPARAKAAEVEERDASERGLKWQVGTTWYELKGGVGDGC